MNAQANWAKTEVFKADGLLRVGGLSALVIGTAYIIIIGLYSVAGAPPVGGEAWLNYLVGKTAVWWAIVGISVFSNFLYVPVALALYAALAPAHRSAMLIGVAFVGLFVTLELAVNWASYASLIMLSGEYAAASTEAQRALLIAAANYPSSVIASPLALVYAVGTLSFGILVIGWVMLKSGFGKLTAYLGIITGVLGFLAVAGVSVAVILNALAATLWLFFVGYRLVR